VSLDEALQQHPLEKEGRYPSNVYRMTFATLNLIIFTSSKVEDKLQKYVWKNLAVIAI
jgi:hypothetical protein